MCAANAEIAMSKGYERWHCDVGRTAQPDASTLAAILGRLVLRRALHKYARQRTLQVTCDVTSAEAR
jgi:hypothetical protein